jgi:anti-anti-sigma factor
MSTLDTPGTQDNTEAEATITHEDIGEDLRLIVISGRLSTPGTNDIAPVLRELTAAPRRGVVVDLSAVAFISSLGIGQLIVNAQQVKARGGHLVVIASGTSAVMLSLKNTGIDRIVPVFEYAPDAHVAALRGF